MIKNRLTLMLLALSLSAAAFGQEKKDFPSISVNGSGEVKAPPDQAIVRLGVTKEAKTAQQAQQQVNTAAQAILDAVRKLGIDPKQIQTSQLNLYPVYSQGPVEPMRGEHTPQIVGYQASNVISVTVLNIQQVGQVIDAGLNAGANQLEGVLFGLQDDTGARRQALTKAAAEARAKADTIAEALGVQILWVHEVVESGVSIQPYVGAREVMMAARADMAAPVSPGEVSVSASLTVRYAIGPPGAR